MPFSFLSGMNTIGTLFKITSFGESHGALVGCVVDGCPAGFKPDLERIQKAVNLRKTGQNAHASQRLEDDQIQIVSGLFEGRCTGSPLCILIQNQDSRPQDYENLKEVFRPNHADFTYQQKYGFRDHRGGGRSSVRITVPLVAAGNLALQILESFAAVQIHSYVSAIGGIQIPSRFQSNQIDWEELYQHPLRVPIHPLRNEMEERVNDCLQHGDTLGGCIQVLIDGVPAGWGEPIFGKLQASLAHAMMSIPSVKAFEYGDGFESTTQQGSFHNDSFITEEGHIRTASNRSGGIQGGISNGEEIHFRIGFKPISSIRSTQKTVNKEGSEVDLNITGRHDVCAVPRALPIVEAYTAFTLLDACLQQQSKNHQKF